MEVKLCLILILLLLLDSTPQTYSQKAAPKAAAECYSLSDSKYCGGSYAEYFLSSNTVIEGIPVSDVASLDRAIEYYFGSPQDIKQCSQYFNCNPLSTWDGVYFPPFRGFFYCRNLLENPFSKVCNAQNPVPPTCQTNCFQSVTDWEFLWGNRTLCDSPGDLLTKQATITHAWCDSFPFNGTQANCVQPKDSSRTVCGYSLPIDLPALCIYCAGSPQAPCCSSDNVLLCKDSERKPRSQPILILPIVMGCLGVLSLAAGLWYYFKRKRQHSRVIGGGRNPTSDKSIPFDSRSTTIEAERITSLPPVYTCIYPYEPSLPDELRINPNDRVAVLMFFEDGWGVGRNLTRGGEGAFPFACLDKNLMPSEETMVFASNDGNIPKRTTSKRNSRNMRIS